MMAARIASRLSVLSVALMLWWAVTALPQQRWWEIGVVLACMLLSARRSLLSSVPGMIVGIYWAQPLLIVAFALLLLPDLLLRIVPAWMWRRRTDRGLLIAALDRVPPSVVRVLGEAAESGPISTETMLKAAAAEQPSFWRGRHSAITSPGWDGEELRDTAGRRWTSIAAETVILADMLRPESEPTSEIQLLAAAAGIVPGSAADERVAPGKQGIPIVTALTGMSAEHVAEMVIRFGSGPAGADSIRRAALRVETDPGREIPPEQLFTVSQRKFLLFTAVRQSGRPRSWLVTMLDFVLIPPALIVMLPYWTVRFLWRLPGRIRRWNKRERAAPPAASAPRADARPGFAARVAHWWRDAAAATSWPGVLALRALRPAGTIGAAILIGLSALPVGPRIAAIALVLLVRPLVRWWVLLPVVAALAGAGLRDDRMLLLAAAALALGVVASQAVLIRWGVTKAVAQPRRLIPVMFTGHARDALPPGRQAFAQYTEKYLNDDAFVGEGIEYLVSVWSDADGAQLWRATVTVFKAELLGKPPARLNRPRVGRRLFLMLVGEWAVNISLSLFAALAAATTAVLAIDGADMRLGPVDLAAWWLDPALAALAAIFLVRTRPRPVRGGIPALVLLWRAGDDVLAVAAAIAGCLVLARLVRSAMERRMLSVAPRMSWVGFRVTGLRHRARFMAAAELSTAGRPGIAVAVLDDIRRASPRPALAAAALSQHALIELDRGRLQGAVELASAAVEKAARTRNAVAKALGAYAQGMVLGSVGSYREAIEALKIADRRLRRTPERGAIASMLAHAYSATDQVDETVAAADRAAIAMRRPGQLLALVESQLTSGWALLRAGRESEASSIVTDAMSMLRSREEPLPSEELSERSRQAWWRLEGQAHLLRARLDLSRGDVQAAAAQLRTCVGHLRRTHAPELLGVVHIYQGRCALAEQRWAEARQAVRDGAKLLENRRGQLRTGSNRTDAILSTLDHYGVALSVLTAACHHGDTESGRAAAELMESLRRNALAHALRAEGNAFADRLTQEARGVIEEIRRLENPATDSPPDEPALAHARGRLAAAVSSGFAAAYSPEEVTFTSMFTGLHQTHVLQFEFVAVTEAGWRGYRVWTPPDGDPWVDEVQISDPDLLAILRGDPQVFKVPLLHVAHRWAALANSLLPAGLLTELRRRHPDDPIRLLITPGEQLAYLPWAALLLEDSDDEHALVDKAVIQVVPSLQLLRAASTDRPAGDGVLVYLDEEAELYADSARAIPWQRLSAAVPVVRTRSREEFEARLSSDIDAGYLTAHGQGDGLSQSVLFSRGGILSAASALTLPWPRRLVFASCFVARVAHRTGSEPLGLAIACMLGGCRSIIGGVFEVHRESTADIAADLTLAIAGGTDPAAALRQAQRRSPWRYGGLLDQWAGLICITTEGGGRP